MSRPRRQPTWVYIDEEFGHVPALPGPEPRERHRHSRTEVRAQMRRGKRRDVRRGHGCTCLLCVQRGGVDARWWRKQDGLARPIDRRLCDADSADVAAALRCDGYDPEPPEPRDEYGRLAELCNLMQETPCPQ